MEAFDPLAPLLLGSLNFSRSHPIGYVYPRAQLACFQDSLTAMRTPSLPTLCMLLSPEI